MLSAMPALQALSALNSDSDLNKQTNKQTKKKKTDCKDSFWKSLLLIQTRSLSSSKRYFFLFLHHPGPRRGCCPCPCCRLPQQRLLQPSPLLLFSFSSPEPCHPGSSSQAVKEDGKPSYRRMITIINIHGWFTYHS